MTPVVPTPPFRRAVPHPGFVLDVIVPTAWLFTLQGTSYTSGVMTRIKPNGAIVPGCWPAQLAEAARLGERRRLRPRAEIDRFLAQLCYFSIRIDGETNTHTWGDTRALSRIHNITVFDAAYLELALRLALPLATIDTTLLRAAGAAGVPVFTP